MVSSTAITLIVSTRWQPAPLDFTFYFFCRLGPAFYTQILFKVTFSSSYFSKFFLFPIFAKYSTCPDCFNSSHPPLLGVLICPRFWQEFNFWYFRKFITIAMVPGKQKEEVDGMMRWLFFCQDACYSSLELKRSADHHHHHHHHHHHCKDVCYSSSELKRSWPAGVDQAGSSFYQRMHSEDATLFPIWTNEFVLKNMILNLKKYISVHRHAFYQAASSFHQRMHLGCVC